MTVQSYQEAGLSFIPCVRAEKRPAGWLLPLIQTSDGRRVRSWKPFQEHCPTEAEVQAWLRRGWLQPRGKANALAIITGQVSGSLEVLDFDAPALMKPWATLVRAQVPGLLERLPFVRTPSGGWHVYYRCAVIAGNQKLAVEYQETSAKPRVETLIETRGEGGYVLAPPSPQYELRYGSVSHIPTLSPATRAVLLNAARHFTAPPPEVVQTTRKKATRHQCSGGDRPGDDFNQRGDVVTLLRHHGWQLARRRGEVEYWRRPGKQSPGWSATRNALARLPGYFYVFSTNAWPLESEQAYSPFSLYATLEHHGDFRRAGQALWRLGYGQHSTGDKP